MRNGEELRVKVRFLIKLLYGDNFCDSDIWKNNAVFEGKRRIKVSVLDLL